MSDHIHKCPRTSHLLQSRFERIGSSTECTTTGIWYVTYNTENRPILFSNETTVVEMAYDHIGRRFEYKETVSGNLTRQERYLYRGYLQIAALDMLNSTSIKHTIVWDPFEPTATRPLVLQNGANAYYYYSFDQVKNVTELFDSDGALAATYDYSPFGQITLALSVGSSVFDVTSNPLTFSSEVHDSILGLQYYNYRHLNTLDGRWVNRDPIGEWGFQKQNIRFRFNSDNNLYGFVHDDPLSKYDFLGMVTYWDWLFNKQCWKCGPDVTDGLKASKAAVETQFNFMKKSDPKLAAKNCDPFFKDWTQDPGFAFGGWDLVSLVWEDVRIRGADGISQCPFGRRCTESVTVNGGCYWKWSVNYTMFGWMAKLCNASILQMESAIVLWKLTKPEDWPQVDNALDFAKAGYNGFPDSGSVKSDDRYKDCKPCNKTYCTSGLGPSWPGGGGRR